MEYNAEEKVFILHKMKISNKQEYDNYLSYCEVKKITPEYLGGEDWSTKYIATVLGEKNVNKLIHILSIFGVLRKNTDIDGYFVTKKYSSLSSRSFICKNIRGGGVHNVVFWNASGVFFIKSIVECYREHLEPLFNRYYYA